MFRSIRLVYSKRIVNPGYYPKRSFLTNDYKCSDAWEAQTSSSILNKVNLNDLYNALQVNHTAKGVISAIDVDIFANAVKDSDYLDELKNLLVMLRLSADTCNTLESTHHACIRNYIDHENIVELIEMLRDPLNFGLFLDFYTANILLDTLLTKGKFEEAAKVASVVMLQEDYSNDITRALCQYASYKYIANYTPPEPEPEEKVEIEEVKIRVAYLRNPYFDDHFDLKDLLLLSGKTLAWMSESFTDNLNTNLQIIGWAVYKKYDKLQETCDKFSKNTHPKVFSETIELLKREAEGKEPEHKSLLDQCVSLLSKVNVSETKLEESIKNAIENAINKCQKEDIAAQHQLFQSWVKIREKKLEEQRLRLDRAKRIETIEEKRKRLEGEEQKLWFFENQDKIELEIERKQKLIAQPPKNKKKIAMHKEEEDYVPPEIVPRRSK